MNATDYLGSLGIEPKRLTDTRVGRLSVSADFHLEGQRGVLLHPKRGGISDRYLELLAADDSIVFVIVEGRGSISVYGRAERSAALDPLLALPVEDPKHFPSPEALDAITREVRTASGRKITRGAALHLTSALFAAKLDDERGDASLFVSDLVTARDDHPVLRAIEAILPDGVASNASTLQSMLAPAALLAGYRLCPLNGDEMGTLIECVAKLGHGREPFAGLPQVLGFSLSGAWAKGRLSVVGSQFLGSQLLPLMNAEQAEVCLPRLFEPTIELLSRLLPNARFHHTDFLDWTPSERPDRVFVSPPLGTHVTSTSVLQRFEIPKRSGKRRSRVSAESLYIEHAVQIAAPGALLVAVVPEGLLASVAHAAFRAWLLDHVRLLAVLSLPAGSCFPGTGVRCSLLYLQKLAAVPEDYSILMIEALDEDIRDAAVRDEMKAAIDETVGQEVGECA